jgi:TonB family protein
MLNDPKNEQHSVGLAESRAHTRLQVHSLAYIELSDENAGLILNISENGIAVQAVQVLTADHFPHMHFRLPRTETTIEAQGRMVWQIRSKKQAGIEFTELTEKTRGQIRAWIAAEIARAAAPRPDNQPAAALGATFHPGQPSAAASAARLRSRFAGAHQANPATSDAPGNGLSDWVSHQPHPKANGDDDSGVSAGRGSTFHLPPLHLGTPDRLGSPEPEEDAVHPERFPAIRRWNGYMAPGVGMEFKKPRRWWTYTAVLGFIAALAFAGLMMFNPDTLTRARIAALARLHGTPGDNSQSAGQNQNNQNAEANDSQQSNPENAETAENSQPIPGLQTPSAGGASSNPSVNQPAITSAPSSAAPTGGDTQLPTATPPARGAGSAAKQTQQPARRYNQSNPANSSRYGSSAKPPVTSLNQTTAPYSRPANPTPPNTPAQAANPPRYEPPANQTARPAAPSVNQNSQAQTSQGQQSAAQRPVNSDVMAAWRAQTGQPSESKGAATPVSSQTNSQPPAQRDQDAYARRPSGISSGSSASPAAGNSAQSRVSTVEMSGPSSPVPPSVPLAGVPSGSVGATSQFHSIRIPPELQAQGAQLTGRLQIGQLISSYSPAYPVEAAREGIEGTVRLDVTVGKDGSVKNVRVVSGPAMLTQSAAEAVQGWRYGETFLGGQPIETQQYVTVVFRLAARSSQR